MLRPLLEVAAVAVAGLVALRLVAGLFGGKPRMHTADAARQMALLFWPLLSMSVGLPFVAFGVFSGPLSTYELGLVLALSVLLLGFAGPALALHAHYYVRNHATAVVFEPKRNVLEVYEAGQRQPFERRDVVRVEYVRCRSRRFFWSSYEYLQLHLADGRALTITSLLLKLPPLAEFLRNANIHTYRRWFCII